jgi:aryl-alcohol dehydrogenase-like predicted oxidoreductase
MDLRPLGNTGIRVSPLGLGTVKIGRNRQVKYPGAFSIPDDRSVVELLALARDLGINLLDTAPAYGTSEARLGKLLPGPRDAWVIVSKVGESFQDERSSFDFSAAATRQSVERTLRRFGTDYLDAVLIHSDGDDLRILDREPVLASLERLKERGLIRAYGISGKTLEGGLRGVELCDLVMVTLNPAHRGELPVVRAAKAAGKGVLVKKGLQSGHVAGTRGVEAALRFVFAQQGVSSVVVGTIDPDHLRQNAAAVEAAVRRSE